jgi:phosphoglucomutase
LRVLFDDGARIVYRLSGTGTAGATLRVYIEAFESARDGLDRDVQQALRPLVSAALSLSELEARTGRDRPTVIT